MTFFLKDDVTADDCRETCQDVMGAINSVFAERESSKKKGWTFIYRRIGYVISL